MAWGERHKEEQDHKITKKNIVQRLWSTSGDFQLTEEPLKYYLVA